MSVHRKPNPDHALLAKLDILAQPVSSAELDYAIQTAIASRLENERYVKLFETAILDPKSAPIHNLPASIQKAVIMYHATANSIADSGLPHNEITLMQAALFQRISEIIASGSNEAPQSVQATEHKNAQSHPDQQAQEQNQSA